MLLFLNERSFISKNKEGPKWLPPKQHNLLRLAGHCNSLVDHAARTLQRSRQTKTHLDVINLDVNIIAPAAAYNLTCVVINFNIYKWIFICKR